MPKKIPENVILNVTIDTECDHDPNWRRSDPLSFSSVLEGIPNRLQPLFDETGAVPTYLLTVEVLEDENCVRALKELKGNYELGTHLHSAFIEPEKKFENYAGVESPDFQCNCASAVEAAKLRNLTELFQAQMGYRPTSFRAGRFGAGPNTVDALANLGYLVDTSVTPHILWKEEAGNVDYRKAPEQPYYPAPEKLIEASDSGPILEVPVTVKPRFLRGPKWFRPWFSSPDRMKEVVRYHLRKYADRSIVSINMMFHSMEIMPKASPYPQSEAEVERFMEDMGNILLWCRDEGIESYSVSEFSKAFRKTA